VDILPPLFLKQTKVLTEEFLPNSWSSYFLSFLKTHIPATPVPRSIRVPGSGTAVGGKGAPAKLEVIVNNIKAKVEKAVTITRFIEFSPPFIHNTIF
jgi:hypothetical protein